MKNIEKEDDKKTGYFKKYITILVLVLTIIIIFISIPNSTFAKWSSSISKLTSSSIIIGEKGPVPVISTEDTLPDSQVNEPYNLQLEASNSDEETEWSSESTFPEGLNLSKDGLISGTPKIYGTFSITITVRNSYGSDTKDFTIYIDRESPKILDQVLPDAFEGSYYSYHIRYSGMYSDTFTIESGELPAGLKITSSGNIYGVPKGYGIYTFTVKIDSSRGSDSKEFSINLDSDYPYISSTSFPDGNIGTYYKQQVEGPGPSPTYKVTKGSLPPGMAINSLGKISGNPTDRGIYEFTITKTNSIGEDSKDFSIRIKDSIPTITSTSYSTARKGVYYNHGIYGAGSNVTYSLSEDSYLPGLSIDPVTGYIFGTPTETGDFDFTVIKSNEAGVVTKSFTIKIILNPPKITTTNKTFSIHKSTRFELENTADGEDITWSVDKLPAGLSINSETGLITGYLENFGNQSFTVIARNSSGQSTAYISLNILYNPAELISLDMPNGEVGKDYYGSFDFKGEGLTYRYEGTLIPGVKLSAIEKIFTGVPTTSGVYNFFIVATNNGGVVKKEINITIDPDMPTITQESIDDIIEGKSYNSGLIAGKGEKSKFAITSGVLPKGIGLTQSGLINGTTQDGYGKYPITITKSNARGSVSKDFILNVRHNIPTQTGSSTLTKAFYDIRYSYQLLGTGNGSTYEVIEGSMPEGFTISDTGLISGTTHEEGSFSFTIRKSNDEGESIRRYTIEVSHVAPGTIVASIPSSTVGEPYIGSIKSTGLDITYSVSYGELHNGLSLDSATGVISGTPTETGVRVIRFEAKNSGGIKVHTASLNIKEVTPTMETPILPEGKVGEPYYVKLEAIGEAITYSRYNNLPSGLTLSPDGIISGTPTKSGVYSNIGIDVSNTGGTIRVPLNFTINP